ncbi:O-antigen ligase family protein [Nostoc sp. 'Peltigera membranacea cyanobiont' 232]|uniref:O-antigen ligase family protein n=2 Tax=unclassified Nostoc TaxID=2593658 RepID=UPI001CB965E3|nr:O-antigen ligase family protein [Nostoc sp. 'Peltigera membranacea cyanobiont' 232]
MNHLYTLLFSLSIILINPIGAMRGEIWTQPKVFAISLICILNFLILWEDREHLKLPQSWKINRLLWEIFLGIGLIATLASPFPWRSLFGQEQMGDGLLYWLLIAIFTLSNNLLLRLHPEIARSQLQGLVIGGVIVALSIFPQAIDWRIDYTATTGQLIQSNILRSTIFQNQQPIGLYSHRGHASFVLAAVAIMTLVGWQWRWISTNYAAIAGILIIPALLLTQTRAGILALLVATIYLLGHQYYKLLVPATLVCLLIIGIATSTRQINNAPLIRQITSDRVYLWEMANRGTSQRPLLGWGMNGFGAVYPYMRYGRTIAKVIRLGDFSFDYQDKNGQIQTAQLPTTKAHNLILDTTLSVGFLGMASYLGLLILCLWQVIKSPCQGIEAIAIAYLAFTFTWFECAQYTHLAWWSLSFFGVSHCLEKTAS